MKRAATETALEHLLQALREGTDEPSGFRRAVPEDLSEKTATVLSLDVGELRAFEQACRTIAADLRFEHLGPDATEAAVWHFACEFAIHQQKRLITRFIEEHARDPFEATCHFNVELLTVRHQIDLQDVRLLPAPEPAKAGSIIAIPCWGTSFDRMANDARPIAEHALRTLRASLRGTRYMPDEQLRFTLGQTAWFDSGAAHWSGKSDQAWELELDDRLVAAIRDTPVFVLPFAGATEIERRASIALRWYEQAQLTVDPLMRVLFCFTALEAILGDKAEGLKGHALAVRRGLLGLLTDDGMRHPTSTYLLYDRIRNAAVHGEDVPPLSDKEAGRFAWDVRIALNQYLRLASNEGLTHRRQMRKLLDGHPRRERVAAGLLRDDAKHWKKFFAPGSRSSASAD